MPWILRWKFFNTAKIIIIFKNYQKKNKKMSISCIHQKKAPSFFLNVLHSILLIKTCWSIFSLVSFFPPTEREHWKSKKIIGSKLKTSSKQLQLTSERTSTRKKLKEIINRQHNLWWKIMWVFHSSLEQFSRSSVHEEDDDDDEETKLKSLFTLLLLDVTASLSISHPPRSLSEAKF